MNAAVTGGTGFLGQTLVQLLVPQADDVRVLVRQSRDDDRIRALGATPVRGDLTLAQGCDDLVRPGDVIFHAAARVDMIGSWADFRKTTVQGTRNLLDSALPRGPARFLYLSSAAVYSPRAGDRGACADRTPARPARYNLYGRAKLAAENLVRTECDRAGCPWTIMRLGFLHGPGNRALLKHFVPLLEKDHLFVIGDGQNRIATCYVDDAAQAALLAATHPAAAGRIYDVASDEPVTQRQFVDALADAMQLPRSRNQTTRIVALGFALLIGLAARLRDRPPAFNRAMVALMAVDQVLDSSRLRNELGWKPEVSFQEGMRRTEAWYLQTQANQRATTTQEPTELGRPQSA